MNMIGIVGGVGPFAGVDLTRKIFINTLAASDQEHLPVALLSVPARIKDRTEYLMGQVRVNPGQAVGEIILQLENLGASVIGIPCNTMHAPEIFDAIQNILYTKGSRVRLLNMVEEVVAFVGQHHAHSRRIGVLSTTGTWKSDIYPRWLKHHGLSSVVPSPQVQQQVHDAVYDPSYGIKACSEPVTQRAREQLLQAIKHLKAAGADAIILGCTELPYALPHKSAMDVPLLDATWILARSLIAHTYPEKLKPLHETTTRGLG